MECLGALCAAVVADAAIEAADRETLGRLVASGVEVRLSASVPSWAYIDAGVLAAVPLAWGEHPPASIVVIRDAAISMALGALAEPIWAAAQPADAVLADPGNTLRLLALGLSDAAVAAAQSSSRRTVQRRIAESMAISPLHGSGERRVAPSITQDPPPDPLLPPGPVAHPARINADSTRAEGARKTFEAAMAQR